MPVQISTQLAKLWKLFFWKVPHDVYIEIAQVMGFPDFERHIHVVNGSHEILTCTKLLNFALSFGTNFIIDDTVDGRNPAPPGMYKIM